MICSNTSFILEANVTNVCITCHTVPMSLTYRVTYCANVGQCECSTRQVGRPELAGVAELYKSTELNSNVKHTQCLDVLHVRHNKASWCVHRKPNVMCCLQISHTAYSIFTDLLFQYSTTEQCLTHAPQHYSSTL